MPTNIAQFVKEELSTRPHTFAPWKEISIRIQSDPAFEGAFVGTYSLTAPKLNTTYVSNRHIWAGEPVSASSVARRILFSGLNLLGRKRIPWNKRALPLLKIPHPLYCVPSWTGQQLYYFDIKAAYYSIYSRLPFDLWFNGTRTVGGKVYFSDFLPSDLRTQKLLRNCIVGCLRSDLSSRVRSFRLVRRQNHNPLLSPYLWGYIASILHSIANKAIELGAVYYNTDGGIFNNLEDGLKWCKYVERLGFVPDLKQHGVGYVLGVGRYKIGADIIGNRTAIPAPFSNLQTIEPQVVTDWLKYL